jgi:hypothetical protein
VAVELGKDFRDLIELLNQPGVRYLAVGHPHDVDDAKSLEK